MRASRAARAASVALMAGVASFGLTPAQAQAATVWDRLAQCESSGNWRINTGNGYYGGLQMDRQFQQYYAPELYRSKGTADHWTAEEQMMTAEKAVRERGFSPWPNTARMCGVL